MVKNLELILSVLRSNLRCVGRVRTYVIYILGEAPSYHVEGELEKGESRFFKRLL